MRRARSLLAATLLALCCSCGGQRADPNFHPAVAEPAFRGQAPRVTYDEGHRNAHTAGGRYRPFVELLRRDGYRVSRGTRQFSALTLTNTDLLVIVNAAGGKVYKIGALELPTRSKRERDHPAFRADEIAAVRDWVRAGGSLLLIADHYPYGASAQSLAAAFDVSMSAGYTYAANRDTGHADSTQLVYTRANGLLADHPIAHGRSPGERVGRVVTFTGQSLARPGGVALLALPPGAYDYVPPPPNFQPASAEGRCQALAFEFGRGRVVVLGEAGMLTAQLDGESGKPFGMNLPDNDDRQFALNVMHWLSRLL